VLRAKGGDLLMVDVEQPIAKLIAALDAERIRTPLVACGTSDRCPRRRRRDPGRGARYVPLPPDPELIAAVLAAVAGDKASLIWRDPAMERVIQLANQIARSDAPVLVTGESGTGKEMIAQHLHQKSLRKDKPFVAVNCAAIPDNLLESRAVRP
jgi:two-component system response regulator FlrC